MLPQFQGKYFFGHTKKVRYQALEYCCLLWDRSIIYPWDLSTSQMALQLPNPIPSITCNLVKQRVFAFFKNKLWSGKNFPLSTKKVSNVICILFAQTGINAGKEITCGYDETQIHPIHHSVMQAVSQVSDLILQSSQRDLATVSSGLSKHPYIPQIPVSKAWNVESWHSLQCTSSDYKHWPIKRCYHRVETLKKFAKNYIQEEGMRAQSFELRCSVYLVIKVVSTAFCLHMAHLDLDEC